MEKVNSSHQGDTDSFSISVCAINVYLHGLELNGNLASAAVCLSDLVKKYFNEVINHVSFLCHF